MDTPENKRQSFPVRKRNKCIMGSPLFLIANTVLLAANLAITESDQKSPDSNPPSQDKHYPPDASVERQGVTIFETEDLLEPQSGLSDHERKFREKLMDIIDPKIIRPVYKMPPQDDDSGSGTIEL